MGSKAIPVDPKINMFIDLACDKLRVGWCKLANSRNYHGQLVSAAVKNEAVSWCASGALLAVRTPLHIYYELERRSVMLCGRSIPSVNDSSENVSDVMLFLQALKDPFSKPSLLET